MPTTGSSSSAPDEATIRRTVAEVVSGDPRVLAVYLFGSRVRGSEMEGSDVDLAALFTEPVEVMERLALEDRIESALGTPVDLLDLGKANAFLALDVIRGERIYCTDSTRCDEFDLYVMRRAGDLEPFERERRRMELGFDPVRPAATSTRPAPRQQAEKKRDQLHVEPLTAA